MIRVGQGFDVHGFGPSRPLVLGGTEIPEGPGLAGHSDADVLCHAIADALMGAGRLGDLGEMFPPTERWAGASSLDILREVAAALRRDGYAIVNVDAVVIAERPKLAPYVPEMRMKIESALEAAGDTNSDSVPSVSVKATTTDGLGFTGRGEGIAALAVALVERSKTLLG